MAAVAAFIGQPTTGNKLQHKGFNMDITIEIITPSQAGVWLSSNTSNRPMRLSLVKQYAKEMASGTWRLTHQGIAFGSDGTLLDGQHRLAAIIESGVPITMAVTRGIDPRSQLVMDYHAKRSSGDALSLVRKEKITAKDVSVIRAVCELSDKRSHASRLTNEELNAIYDTFKPALDFVNSVLPSAEKGVSSAPVKSALVLAWYYTADLEKLSRFCDVLSGRQMPDGEHEKAAIVLREHMLKGGTRNVIRVEIFEKAQRAIAAFIKGQSLSRLCRTVEFEWPLKNPVRTLC